MSRKRRGNVNPLETPASTGLTAKEWADAGYGGLDMFEDRRVIAEPISIFDIFPDPAQPRRTLPSAIRQRWDGQASTTPNLFMTWLVAIHDERGTPFNVDVYFQDMDIRSDDAESREAVDAPPGPLESAFIKLIELAASIRREGLTNPITVATSGSQYIIETGERRWLAYHLLHWQFSQSGDDEEDWSQIPARAMPTPSVWRQASENNARDDLNAIGKARQFAILLMDLLTQNETRTRFQPMDAFAHEQDFYAQVADSDQYRIPRGAADLLMGVLSLKSRRQLSHYRALLTLPQLAWTIADDYNLTEYRLRQVLDLKLDDETTNQLVYQAAQEYGDDMGTTVPLSQTHKPPREPVEDPLGFATLRRHSQRLRKYLSQPGALTPDKREDALERIAVLRRLLDEMEISIRSKTQR